MSMTRFSARLRANTAIAIGLAGVVAAVVLPGAARAELPPASTAKQTMDPQIARLVHDAEEDLRANHLDLAILHLKNAVVLQPHNGEVRARLGLALLMHGEVTSAEAELKTAKSDGAPDGLVNTALMQIMLSRNEMKLLLDSFPDPAPGDNDKNAMQVLVARGVALLSLNQLADAKSAMDRALVIQRSTGALLGRAEVARAQNDTALSDQLIDEAMKASPNDVHILLAKAESLRTRDAAKALQYADRMLAIEPKNIIAKIERISLLEDLHQNDKAMGELDAVLAKSPRMPIALYYKAVFLSKAHQTQKAWLIVQSLPKEFVQADPNIAMTIAGIASESGNSESGGAILDELVNNHPENNVARLKLGAVRIQQGAYDLAGQVLSPLVQDGDRQALALMAEASVKQGHYTETLDFLERANQAPGETNELLKKDLALAEVNFGKAGQGIADLQKLADKEPGRVEFSGPLIGALIREKRFGDAETALARFSAAIGHSPFVDFYRADILLAKGDRAGAISAFNASLSIDPKFVPSLFYRAKAEAAGGQTSAATQDIDRVLAVDPANAAALIQKATFLASAGQDGAAIASLKLAIEKSPRDPLPRLALTNLQISRKKYDEAGVTIAAWLQVIPNDADALSHLGVVELAKGQKREAVATYGTLADRFPRSANAQLLLAQAQAVGGDNAGTVASAKRALILEPDSLPVRSSVIALELKAGAGDSALAAAKDFQSAHAGVDADLLVADVYFQMKRYDDAKAVLRQSQASTDSRVVMHLAQLHALQGDTQGGVALVKAALDKKPSDVALRRAYAGFLLQSGNSAGARSEYENVLRSEPNDVQSLNDLAWLIQDQDPKRAFALATRATQLAPASGEIADTLGWIMYHHGDAKGASAVLVRAHSASKDNGEITYHLAVVLNALGQHAEAKTMLKSALAGQSFSDQAAAQKLVAQW